MWPINAMFSGLGGGAMPSMPTLFAEGGLVTRPTMGVVGEAGPEAIFPLDTFFSQMMSMFERVNKPLVDAIKQQKLHTRITNNQLEIASTPSNA